MLDSRRITLTAMEETLQLLSYTLLSRRRLHAVVELPHQLLSGLYKIVVVRPLLHGRFSLLRARPENDVALRVLHYHLHAIAADLASGCRCLFRGT